jgi:MFS transporter, DHA1 family, solute carrier family 18 (vesicular acetylcholine transporter), member 3
LLILLLPFPVGPIAGALADRYGAETLVPAALLLALPWQPLLSLKSSLPAFIAFFALSNALSSAFMTPVGRELAVASKDQEGIGEIRE